MNKVKVVQIGCGGRNGVHLQKLSTFDDVEIVGFCDIIEERAKARVEAYGSGKAYTDYKVMLEELKPDVAFVAVPPYVHGEIESELIKHKVHFLMEKPMALDYSVAEKICDDAEAAGLICACGFQDRYQYVVEVMKDYLKGKEKDVGLVTACWIGGAGRNPWLRTRATCGGQMVEQNIHLFDQLRYLFGDVDSVYCSAGKGITDPVELDIPGYDLDDYTSATVNMKCGVVANILTGNYLRYDAKAKNGMMIYGKDFMMEYALRNWLTITDTTGVTKYVRVGEQLTITAPDGTSTVIKITEQTGIQDRAYIDAIKSGDTSGIRATYRESLKSLRLVLACNESAASKKIIQL